MLGAGSGPSSAHIIVMKYAMCILHMYSVDSACGRAITLGKGLLFPREWWHALFWVMECQDDDELVLVSEAKTSKAHHSAIILSGK